MNQRRPDRSEADEYYFRYIDLIDEGDIVSHLRAQAIDFDRLLRGVPEEKGAFRYAPGKWSLKQVIGHINDTERVFSARAFWFARGFEAPLPSFDQDISVAAGGFDERRCNDLVDEFAAVRKATLALFATLPTAAWDGRGVASGKPFSVRALAYLAAGHVEHHRRIIESHYLGR